MARAMSDLPVPLSPVMSTLALVSAMLSIISHAMSSGCQRQFIVQLLVTAFPTV